MKTWNVLFARERRCFEVLIPGVRIPPSADALNTLNPENTPQQRARQRWTFAYSYFSLVGLN
jgi:hypothetical protein